MSRLWKGPWRRTACMSNLIYVINSDGHRFSRLWKGPFFMLLRKISLLYSDMQSTVFCPRTDLKDQIRLLAHRQLDLLCRPLVFAEHGDGYLGLNTTPYVAHTYRPIAAYWQSWACLDVIGLYISSFSLTFAFVQLGYTCSRGISYKNGLPFCYIFCLIITMFDSGYGQPMQIPSSTLTLNKRY